MKNLTTLIIGANSGIAKSLAQSIIDTTDNHLIVVSRETSFYRQAMFSHSKVMTVNDYGEETIRKIVAQIAAETKQSISKVFICHGVLHTDASLPEKRLEDFSPTMFHHILTANTVTPMLWLKYLTPRLSGKVECKVTIFSARVGSITDNQLGGWYSYRASKAALNMLIKSASIELTRRAKNIKLISFHPGTTDTPLSKPFQNNVPDGKLFTSDFVAQQLLAIVNKMPIDGQASFIDWQGENIAW
jgi:NAD(P)-dependent dehydrogenase (short-subunit alcohol dehydrogenase family)